MPETNIATQTAEPKPAVQAEPAQVAQKEDLVTRASKVGMEVKPEAKPEEATFNVNDLDKIQDPQARKLAEDAYKSFQADYTRKTQALASERKEMEALKAKLEQSGQYTPAKISELLNDPSFVQAAQEYQRINGGQQTPVQNNGDLTQEEFSYLTPEQQKLYVKTKQMEQSLSIVNNRLQASEVSREDMSLKSKYANYDPDTVNQIYRDMMSGKIQATREHLWKVADYESAVERGYRLGLEDRKLEVGQKVAASSDLNGMSVTPAGDTPIRGPKESGIEYFKRIALHNAQKFMKKG